MNKEFITPYIEQIIKCQSTISFETDDPDRLAYILRTALNTDWLYLREEFGIYRKANKVIIRRKLPQVNNINKQVPIQDKDMFEIASDIMNVIPYPHSRYSTINLSDEEKLSILKLADSKGYKSQVHSNYLEIIP